MDVSINVDEVGTMRRAQHFLRAIVSLAMAAMLCATTACGPSNASQSHKAGGSVDLSAKSHKEQSSPHYRDNYADITPVERKDRALAISDAPAPALESLPQGDLADLFLGSDTHGWPENIDFTPLVLSDGNELFGQTTASDETGQRMSLAAYDLEDNVFRIVDSVADTGELDALRILAASERHAVFEQYNQDTQRAAYLLFDIKKRTTSTILSVEDAPMVRTSAAAISGDGVMINYPANGGDGYKLAFLDFATDRLVPVEDSFCTSPVHSNDRWYYLLRNLASQDATLVELDMAAATKTIVASTRGADRYMNDLASNGTTLFIDYVSQHPEQERDSINTLMQVDLKSRQATPLFTAHWIESAQASSRWLTWLGDPLEGYGDGRVRPESFVWDLREGRLLRNEAGSVYLGANGMAWMAYRHSDGSIAKGALHGNGTTGILFRADSADDAEGTDCSADNTGKGGA